MTDAEQAACGAISGIDAVSRQQSAARLIDLLGGKEAFDFAAKSEIVSLVAHSLREGSGTDKGLSNWKNAHTQIQMVISLYLVEMDRIAQILSDNNIMIVALKNGGIARGIYPCAGCCPMGDLDFLVDKKNFRKAHEILLKEGYRFEFRNTLKQENLEIAELNGDAEYWKILPNGEKLWFELQWRPVSGRWLRPDQEPSGEELIDRSISVAGTKVRILSPEDNLLQVCLHTAKHTYVRAPGFRLHLDVERIVRYQAIDWELFANRVRSYRVKTPVYFSLLIPRVMFGTPIPEKILQQLCPQHWKVALIMRWLQRVGYFDPHGSKFGRVGYIVFNSLLYDDLNGLLRGVFPSASWMRETYGIGNTLLLPFYYIKRLANLAFKRLKT